MKYLSNTDLDPSSELLEFTVNTSEELWHIDPSKFESIAQFANANWEGAWKVRHSFDPANFVPERNLSGGLGESFGAMLIKQDPRLIRNPHSDGYPDILPNNADAKPWVFWPRIEGFDLGGFDMKSQYCKDFNIVSPSVKAHHRQTKKVMLLQWTYNAKKVPVVLGIYYCNNLVEEDWGVPTMGTEGSKTTPCCGVNSTGKNKLRFGWIIMHESLKFKKRTNKKIIEQYGLRVAAAFYKTS